MSESQPIYYFAYGSNLSTTQMEQRCPSSRPVGLAFLKDYTFIINGRGYANVVQNGADDVANDPGVYGVLYTIGPEDEASLDGYEGVPYAYTKEYTTVEFVVPEFKEAAAGFFTPHLITTDTDTARSVDTKNAIDSVLVYIDRERTSPGPPQPEYIDRMSRGVEEASARFGLPEPYVTRTIGRWIPGLKIPTTFPAAAEELSSSRTA